MLLGLVAAVDFVERAGQMVVDVGIVGVIAQGALEGGHAPTRAGPSRPARSRDWRGPRRNPRPIRWPCSIVRARRPDRPGDRAARPPGNRFRPWDRRRPWRRDTCRRRRPVGRPLPTRRPDRHICSAVLGTACVAAVGSPSQASKSNRNCPPGSISPSPCRSRISLPCTITESWASGRATSGR